MSNDFKDTIQERQSSSSIMTVGEMIDNAFGEPEVNVVHHKLLQSILYLLARQLRILQRRVAVNIPAGGQKQYKEHKTSSTLSVTEVKIQATIKKKNEDPKSGSDYISKKDKISSDKRSSDKTGSSRIPADDSRSDKLSSSETSTDKSSSDKISSGRTITDKTEDKTPSEKTSKDKRSSGKSTDKRSTDKTSKPDEIPTKRSMTATIDRSLDKITMEQSTLQSKLGKSSSLQDYQKLLETVEEMRERELRIIRQRTDSREEHDKTPTPMASLESVEATYEKLLVVERISSEEAEMKTSARGKAIFRRDPASAPRISVVTQEQFDDLAYIVSQIQEKLGPVSTPGFPENAQLMQDLRKGASLTDAMAALQLSARLEATEITLKNMLLLVTELAKQTPGVNLTDNIQEIFGEPAVSKGENTKKQEKTTKKGQPSPPTIKGFGSDIQSQPEMSVEIATQHIMAKDPDDVSKDMLKEQVTHAEMQKALKELNDQLMKTIDNAISSSVTNSDNAMKVAGKLEGKLQASLKLGDRMVNLETLVSNYAEQINILDTSLSSQMSNYQEELTQMQHDLEVGLENMAEMMANTGGDATAVAELNAHFNDLQANIDSTASKQNELKDIQRNLSVDLESLRKQIEVLRGTKSDREEVVDALRDKAGLGALNGLVSVQQFDAVQGDFEKRIGAAYDKFNNQELVWQKAIDDLLKDLNNKADIYQVEGLRDQINHHLENMRVKMNFIIDIVGEPNAAALSKKLNRNTSCLSCAAPAQMKPEEPSGIILPALRPTVGAEAQKSKGDGDHGVCFPGLPIPHPRDPRSHVCNRWCGGSHTVLTTPISRAPPGMIITTANQEKQLHMEMGPDGTTYAADTPQTLKPCWQCSNIPATSPGSPMIQEKKPGGLKKTFDLCPNFNSIDVDWQATGELSSELLHKT